MKKRRFERRKKDGERGKGRNVEAAFSKLGWLSISDREIS